MTPKGHNRQRQRTVPLYPGAVPARSSDLLAAPAAMCGLLLSPDNSEARQAYGSINNFVTDNDTGHACHGFEILIEDCLSTDGCTAVNAAGYIIATAHLDGTGIIDNRPLLLTPDKVPAPSVVTLTATDITPIGATPRGCRATPLRPHED